MPRSAALVVLAFCLGRGENTNTGETPALLAAQSLEDLRLAERGGQLLHGAARSGHQQVAGVQTLHNEVRVVRSEIFTKDSNAGGANVDDARCGRRRGHVPQHG
jgi:hypothetical protein